ncbi:hypothetical protein V1525DRAFT_395780 [Lipomyces kononenkoae]|uniref:Uncharacterized protein n=1 Tax=Lipomyces kononenkoae TaxID=34357 RepID=A0ACC3T8V1_LIPKO
MEVSTLTAPLHPGAAVKIISLALDGIPQHATKAVAKTEPVKSLASGSEKVGMGIEKVDGLAITHVRVFPPTDEAEMTKDSSSVMVRTTTDDDSSSCGQDRKIDDHMAGISTIALSTISPSAPPRKRKRAQTLFDIVKHRRKSGASLRQSALQSPAIECSTSGKESLKRKREFEFGHISAQDQPLKRRAGVDQWHIVRLRRNSDSNKQSMQEAISGFPTSRRQYATSRQQNAGSDADDESSEREMSISSVRSRTTSREESALVVRKLSLGHIIAIPVFDTTQTKLDATNITELIASVPILNAGCDMPPTTGIDRNDDPKREAQDNNKKGRKLAEMLLSMDILTTPELTTSSSSSGTESSSSPDTSPASSGAEHCVIKDIPLEVVQRSPPPPYTSPQQSEGYNGRESNNMKDLVPRILTCMPNIQDVHDGAQLLDPSSPTGSSPSAIVSKGISPLTELFQRLQLNGTIFDAQRDEELLEYTDTEATLSFAARFKSASVYVDEEADKDSAISF